MCEEFDGGSGNLRRPASKGAPPPRQASGRQEKSARTAPEVTIARVLAPAKLVKDLSDEIQAASVRYTLRAARGGRQEY
jgi:hypothetical protein